MNTYIPPLWENPEIQEINRLPMSSPFLPFSSPQAALTDAIAGPEYPDLAKNSLYLSLDGLWTFKLLDNPGDDSSDSESAVDYFSVPLWAQSSFEARKSGGKADKKLDGNWGEIAVPGTWTRQGGNAHYENCYDKPHYTNVQMPFQEQPPKSPVYNPTGLYRRTFALPQGWKALRTVLHIGSAESCFFLYINGIFVGAGKDTRLPSEFDISPYLRDGENLICIKVVRYSDASYVEDQDQWWFGGIHRSVFLYATEDCYIKDIRAYPGNLEGRLNVALSLGGKIPESRSTGNEPVSPAAGEPFTITYTLYPFTLPRSRQEAEQYAADLLKSEPVVQDSFTFVCDYRQNANTAETALYVSNPRIWSHETPNLYVLLVSINLGSRHIESAAFLTGT
jgi:beta-galactosidase